MLRSHQQASTLPPQQRMPRLPTVPWSPSEPFWWMKLVGCWQGRPQLRCDSPGYCPFPEHPPAGNSSRSDAEKPLHESQTRPARALQCCRPVNVRSNPLSDLSFTALLPEHHEDSRHEISRATALSRYTAASITTALSNGATSIMLCII